MMKKLTAALGVLALSGALAFAAENEYISGNINVGGNATITGQLSSAGQTYGAPFGLAKNLIDNGAMLLSQRGTGAATSATTAGCAITSYAADRWCGDVNVTSGAGQLTQISSTPTPPTGFQFALKLVRNSGALTQPQCAWQEIPKSRVVPVAGQNVMLSAQVAALAGLSADNGNLAQLVIITGTGADEGLGALKSAVGMTATPAITPAWTGIATLQTTNLTLTTSFARFNGASVAVGSTVTEMAVGVCFTPAAGSGGATDGIAFTGVQLEVVGTGVTSPSAFEFRPVEYETALALQYYWSFTELASNAARRGTCQSTTTTNTFCVVPLPTKMTGVPTVTVPSAGFAVTEANGTIENCTTLAATANGHTATAAALTCTTAANQVAGNAALLVDNNNSGTFTVSTDF